MKTRSVAARPARLRDSEDARSHSRSASRGFIVFCCASVIVSAFLKLPSLRYPFSEGDEHIYWQLADNLARGRECTLQGTEVLRELSPDMYDRPLFHHPPLFPALLVPFVLTDNNSAAVMVSWLGHFLCLIAVALVGRRALLGLPTGAHITSPAFWLSIVGLSADPLLMSRLDELPRRERQEPEQAR